MTTIECLKNIIALLEKLVLAKDCSLDGGPGSGVKGHATAGKEGGEYKTPNNLDPKYRDGGHLDAPNNLNPKSTTWTPEFHKAGDKAEKMVENGSPAITAVMAVQKEFNLSDEQGEKMYNLLKSYKPKPK